MAVLSFLSGVAFWYSVRNLDRREDELNNLPEGHLRF
jgi:POT family proton-dependent oligopeptide transporter